MTWDGDRGPEKRAVAQTRVTAPVRLLDRMLVRSLVSDPFRLSAQPPYSAMAFLLANVVQATRTLWSKKGGLVSFRRRGGALGPAHEGRDRNVGRRSFSSMPVEIATPNDFGGRAGDRHFAQVHDARRHVPW